MFGRRLAIARRSQVRPPPSAAWTAGIRKVRTLDAAYLVSAVVKDGEQVTFMVDPIGGGAAGQRSSATGQQSGAAPGQQGRLQSRREVREGLTSVGFTNVESLDAAYL